ncbi:hypothetical protein H5410_015291 [Solanum commersonii]|uniref:Uncharacterized protein n=1 Tax=Solanum commersonii TaxID=4109 RepID=A0A9J5ZTP1_SOLCO|nr:hypothetical protein H5410_015291 [Solanum commersonii]
MIASHRSSGVLFMAHSTFEMCDTNICLLTTPVVSIYDPLTTFQALQFSLDKILEHLEDQEHAATLGVSLKILAHPNDVIGKVYGVEHSSCVRGIGGNVCPSTVFGMPRHSISHANVDLEKHVETLEEKLTGYKETKEKLEETKKRLAQNENHLKTLHMFLQAKFDNELPSFNIDSS